MFIFVKSYMYTLALFSIISANDFWVGGCVVVGSLGSISMVAVSLSEESMCKSGFPGNVMFSA